MNTTATIYQCQTCNRQFELEATGTGSLALLERPRLCTPTMFHCQLDDCAAVTAANAEREQARQRQRLANRRDRRDAKQFCKTESRKQKAEMAERPPVVARMPYKDVEPQMGTDETQITPATNLGINVGGVVEKALSQHDFVASGQADSQNAKLMEFFSLPHNFNKWFKSTFLEELSGATRMNNRAVDLRPAFIELGHYIDNCMMTDEHTDRKASYYRVCNIEDAVSLSAEQKLKLAS